MVETRLFLKVPLQNSEGIDVPNSSVSGVDDASEPWGWIFLFCPDGLEVKQMQNLSGFKSMQAMIHAQRSWPGRHGARRRCLRFRSCCPTHAAVPPAPASRQQAAACSVPAPLSTPEAM